LRTERAKQADTVPGLEQLHRTCTGSVAHVEHRLGGYPEPLGLLDEELEGGQELGEAHGLPLEEENEDEASSTGGKDAHRDVGAAGQETCSKQKRAAKEQLGTAVAKRQRGNSGFSSWRMAVDAREMLMREGLEWYRGYKFRVKDRVRGLLLIDTAAKGGLALAVATCQFAGSWGCSGDSGDRKAAFGTVHDIVVGCEGSPFILAEAEFMVGTMYKHGNELEKSAAEAMKWYRKAAEKGHASAAVDLGLYYARGEEVAKDTAEAEKWFKMAAKQGYASAFFQLAKIYETGTLTVKKNQTEAVKWYQKAAEQGHNKATRAMVVCYWEGIGVEKNDTEAARWADRVDD
jgi:hypothetical protein